MFRDTLIQDGGILESFKGYDDEHFKRSENVPISFHERIKGQYSP